MDFRQSFKGHRKVLLVVVHVENLGQTLRNVEIARNNGAHGVFLINHTISELALFSIYRHVRRVHPDLWIGLNMLGLSPQRAFMRVPSDASGLWIDRGGIDLTNDDATREAREISRMREQCPHWQGVHFGGVAFKYQPKFGNPAEEARLAMAYMDVLTTSGDGTGLPPSVEKISAMRDAVGDKPLAIASGITVENAEAYLPHADCFLVASGISHSDTELDPVRVRLLADLIRAW